MVLPYEVQNTAGTKIVHRFLSVLTAALCMTLLAAPLGAAKRGWEYPPRVENIELRFTDTQGHSDGLERFSGSPLLINFWASWCAPCLIELPALDRLAQDPARGPLKIVVLSLDGEGMEPVLEVFRRVKIRNLEPLVGSGEKDVAVVRMPALPFTMLVSAQGRVLATRRGRVDWDSPVERKALRALISKLNLDGRHS